MFQIFMMVTNGAMCFMSAVSFAKSLYDNCVHHRTVAQAQPQDVPHPVAPPKLLHLSSGCMHHDHHNSKKLPTFTVNLSGAVKTEENHDDIEMG